jgi:hypothetical protein
MSPFAALTQLLTNLTATPISELADWLQDQWKQRNPVPEG